MTNWTESGLYASVLYLGLHAPLVTTAPPWTVNTDKFFLTNNSDTPNYAQAAASAIYATTNEVSGTNWAAGGVQASALGAGATDIVLTLAVTGPGPSVLVYSAQNVSVATTTLTGAYGGYFYCNPAVNSLLYKIIGIYFGGSGYSTVAGTFAITWASGVIANITCAS
jgi:hypothetical protein